jgi:hypothetical protein
MCMSVWGKNPYLKHFPFLAQLIIFRSYSARVISLTLEFVSTIRRLEMKSHVSWTHRPKLNTI